MFDFALDKKGCQTDQTYVGIQEHGVQGCGTWLAYIYFISYILLMRIIMVNLFLAIVIEGFFETLLEEEAVISSVQMQDFLTKWSEYDPTGSGFITFEDLIFLLNELPPPLGFKEDNMKYNFHTVKR